MKVLFTGGGTGGHIYPILAVCEQLKLLMQAKELNLYFMGVCDSYREVLENKNIKVISIASAKWRRYFDFRNIIDIPKFFYSIIQSLWNMFWLMPDVIFSKGGPGSVPVVLAGSFFKIPIIIHESDSIPGRANRIAAKYADRIGISFESSAQEFANIYPPGKKQEVFLSKIALVGNPVREDFLRSRDQSQEHAKKNFGFDASLPLIMVVCGSQGAVRINDFMVSVAKSLVNEGVQILHQTGVKHFDIVSKEIDSAFSLLSGELRSRYKVVPYFESNIDEAYTAADLVVSRAGSGSIFEIATVGKPAILLPLPDEVVGMHQIKNAFFYSQTGAAVSIEEENLKDNLFVAQVKKILFSIDTLAAMSRAAKDFSRPDAAKLLADEIMRLGL